LSANGVNFDDLTAEQKTQALEALKGPKPKNEVVIDLTGIQQKGYPAPVNLSRR
jgi:hypothetical protein